MPYRDRVPYRAIARSGLIATAIFLALTFFIWAENQFSEEFHSCVTQHTNRQSTNNRDKTRFTFGRWIGPQFGCSLDFIDQHNGIITAFAGIAVAAFTLTLRRSTDRLWAEAKSQRRDTRIANANSLIFARRAAEAAVAMHRPWLKINLEIAGDFLDDGHGVRLEFTGKIINIGQTPATNLQVWVGMACGGTSYQAALDKTDRPIDHFGNSLFPGEPPTERFLAGRITPEEIEAAKPKGLAGDYRNLYLGVAIVASVTYQFTGGIGRTTKAYALSGPGAGGILQVVDFSRLPVAKDRLRLDEVPVHDTAT